MIPEGANVFVYLARNFGPPMLLAVPAWLQILRRTRDYRSLSRAFMESDEYKARRE